MHLDMPLENLVNVLQYKEHELASALDERYTTRATGTRFVDNEGFKSTSDMVFNKRLAKILFPL